MNILRKRIFCLSIVFIFLTGCTTSTSTEADLSHQLKEAELEKQKLEDSIRQINLSNSTQLSNENSHKKYIFIEIKTSEAIMTIGDLNGEKPDKRDFNHYVYYSDIIQIDDFDEDKEYKEIDKYQKRVSVKLNEESKITDRKAFIFDTYTEASISRNEKVN